ncbi:MAG: peptidoglycan-binding protein [Clostridia bacterium]|nr:peptidoglycan-binding protein [Clostridia bacterium]
MENDRYDGQYTEDRLFDDQPYDVPQEGSYDQPLFEEQAYEEPPRQAPKKKKKKKRTLKRILRGFGRYMAQLPARSLMLIGGIVVLAIAAIVLLIVLLPGKEKVQEPDPQLGIQDAATPTPTLPPISTPAPTPEATPTPAATIKEGGIQHGDTDDLVPGIQERLVELGYMEIPEGGYTNKFGSATRNALRRFQQRHFENYKDWDGVVGQKTYELLFSETAKAFYMKSGDSDESLYDGERVTKLQKALIEKGYMTGTANGTYGPTTREAVTKFQTDNKLDADGVAGAGTLALLYGTAEPAAQGEAPATSEPPASVTASPNETPVPEDTAAPETSAAPQA